MSLPPGLAINPLTGQISGVPTTPGVYSFTLRVRDAQGVVRDLPQSIEILPYTPPELVGVLAQFSNRSVPYSSGFTVSGGTPPFTWVVASGTLPTGVTINASTGVISGTPSDTSYVDRTITVRATDAAGSPAQRTGVIRYADTLALSGSLGAGIQNTAYSSGFTRSGGHSPFVFSLQSGSLPPGLSLNSTTGIISGTPVGVTSNAITIRVTDASGAAADRSQTLVVNSAYVPLAFSGSVAGGTQDVLTLSAFSISPSYAGVSLSGGTTPVTFSWSRISGSTSISPGSPTSLATTFVGSVAPGSSVSATFRCTATDSISSATIDVVITVTNVYQALSVSSSLGRATRLFAYSSQPVVSGGASPYSFAIVSGSLPAGLSINASTGQISGTPSDTTYTDRAITIRCTDGLGASADAPSTMIYRNAPGFSYSLPAAMRTRNYNTSPSLTAGGHGFGSMTISSGSLPAGLSLAPSTGTILGTPTDTSYGTRSLNFVFTDAAGNVANQTGAALPYADNLSISGTLPAAAQGVAYSASLTASGGFGGNSWSVIGGSLPAGLSINSSTGAVTGTPTATGTSSFTVRVTDSQGFAAESSQSITVSAGLSVSLSSGSASAGFVNSPPSFTPDPRTLTTSPNTVATPSGGTPPYTYSWVRISGSAAITATAPSSASTAFTGSVSFGSTSATFRVTVTDAALATASADVAATLNYQSGF